jgi:hypothetical protein
VEVGQLSRCCGESQALHCLGETGSKLKLTVSPREKLISNSQACPVSRRDWWLLLIYQPFTGPLLRNFLLQRPHSTKEAESQTSKAESLKDVQKRRTILTAMQPNISTLRRDSLGQSPYKKIKASPCNLKSEERVQNIHWTDIYVYISISFYFYFTSLLFHFFVFCFFFGIFLIFNFNFYFLHFFLPCYCYLTPFFILS